MREGRDVELVVVDVDCAGLDAAEISCQARYAAAEEVAYV